MNNYYYKELLNLMSIKKTGTWWSQRSIAQTYLNHSPSIIDSCNLVKKESIIPQEKHTFFPGNEITRNRLEFMPKLIFRADSKKKVVWDLCILAIVLYISVMIPFSLSYMYDLPEEIYRVLSSFLFIDIVIGFNTSYFIGGTALTDRYQIAIHYLKTWLLLDVISAFPTEYFINMNIQSSTPEIIDQNINISRSFLLLKVLKILKVPRIIDRISDISSNKTLYTVTTVFSHLLGLIIPMHWVVCLFNVLYSYYLEHGYEYWPTAKLSIGDRYLMFLARIMQTMTSVGFGENTVKTVNERIVMIMTMCFTPVFLGFFVGRIKIVIINSNKNNAFFVKIRNNLRSYLERHNLPKPLRTKVNAYIRHLKFTYNNNLTHEEDIVKLLSIPLREQIFLCTKGYILVGIGFFSTLSRPCIRSFGYEMSLEIFGPQDSIIKQGELTSNLYFINTGTVQIYHEESQTIFTELHHENIFGEIGFLLKQARTASARSSSFSELYSLSRHEVDKILSTMPRDHDRFQVILRNLSSYGISVLGTACYLCRRVGHIARECPCFIWKPDFKERKEFKLNKAINPETLSPGIEGKKQRYTRMRYNVHNTMGRKSHPGEFFRDNKFLTKRALEYTKLAMGNERKHGKLLELINQSAEEGSSGESDREGYTYCKIEYFSKPTINITNSEFYTVKAYSQESEVELEICN